MRLMHFSVSNYRSITKAKRIPISQSTTILIGRNNEGKSNLLRALSIAMRILQDQARGEPRIVSRRPIGRRDDGTYWWERDFPMALQSRKEPGVTTFRLEFKLTKAEVNEFKREVESNLNGNLPIEIEVGIKNRPSIKVAKRGRGAAALSQKSAAIARFVADRTAFNYIPAIRTDQEAIEIIGDMISQELRILENDEKYEQAMQVIRDLQTPLLNSLAARIQDALSEFLPSIREVQIELADGNRRTTITRDVNVIIDDGTATSIESKGDGVKSLAALGLLKNRFVRKGASIIAIEEPESHLHPAAIHQLNEVLVSLAESNQVIITTHNPLFVDRRDVRSNIIIDHGTAVPAQRVSDIRELLGIKASDNLVNARYVLVVEGGEDQKALEALLPVMSEKLGRAIQENMLIVQPVRGAGKLSYHLQITQHNLCAYHVLLDNDESGKKAFDDANSGGLLPVSGCTLVTCPGMRESEFEDCIDVNLYRESVLAQYGVDLDVQEFKSSRKWSERIRDSFVAQGKPWDEKIKKDVKHLVADCVSDNPENALNPHKRQSIDALVAALNRLVA